MATVVNTRSVALANANPRLLNAANAAVILTASTPVFHVDTSNNITPSSITLTAQLISIVGTVTFSSSGCTLTGVSGNTATLTAANMTNSSATVTATITYRGQTFSSTVSINKVLDGATGPTGSASYVVVSTTNQVFSRANSAASYAPTSATLTATPYGGTATYQWQYWTGSAWTNVASSGTSSTYVVASGDFTDARTYRVQATINSVVYTDQITMVQVTGGSNGTNGANAIAGFLTNESVTFAATNSGTVSDFTPANGTFKVFDGVTDKTGASVTYSVVSQTGCTISINTAGTYSVSAMSTDTATAVLQGVYNGVTLQQTLSLAKAKAGSTGGAGSRGAGHWYASGSAWSDTTADSTCPGGKVVGDVVTISNSTFVMTKRWDGSTWAVLGTVVDGTLLVSGSVIAAALAAGSVTTEKMLVSGSNLIPNSDFATGDFTNWRPFTTPANISIIPASTSGVPTGATSANVCKMLNAAGGQVSMFTHASAYADANASRDGFAVTQGEQYNAKIDFAKTSDLSATTLSLVAYFYKSDGTHTTVASILDLRALATTTFQTFSAPFTVPAGALRCWLYVNFVGTAGSIYWSNLRCARMADSALVVDGGIKANHISVTNLAAVNAVTGALTVNDLLTISTGGALTFGQTAYDTGTGGWIQGGSTPKMSLKAANGAYFKCDPTNNVLQMNGASVVGGTVSSSIIDGSTTNVSNSYTIATIGDISGSIAATGSTTTVGTVTLSQTGGKSSYQRPQWSSNYVSNNGVTIMFSLDSTGTVATIKANSKTSGSNSSLDITIVGIDANGFSCTRKFNVYVDAT